MKAKFTLLVMMLSLMAFTANAQVNGANCCENKGQEASKDEIRYNQYGVPVNRTKLQVEERNGILVMESKNSDYRVWFDTRVQVDGAAFFGENKDFDPIGNGVSIRRARFAMKAQVTPDWYGEIDTDFANGVFELKDAIIRYSGLKNFEFTVGNFKEGFSMEATTTSRYLPFMERPMIVHAFAPSRHIGLQGNFNKNWFLAIAGIHYQAVEDLETRVNVEDNNKDFGRNTGYSYTGKIVAMPFASNPNYGLHFGAAASYRTPKSDMATSEYGGVRYSTRNSTSINRKKYLDTDVIKDVNHDLLYGAEFAGFYKGLRFQGEYIGNNTYLNTVPGASDKTVYKFNGWYAYAGWLIFGGQYQYNTSEGEFTQPRRGKSWGDIELLARYDYINLNSGNIYGGSAQAYTIGLNYYINNNFKVMVNYQYNDNDRYANGKGKLYTGYDASGKPTKDYTKIVTEKGMAGVDYSMLSIRFEIDF
ncbi:MAG: porin [Bacteroidales bacterium]|nr:porin [Bacteroidales bacterium]MDD4669730.1 porin [Bacteroidales bacterium]